MINKESFLSELADKNICAKVNKQSFLELQKQAELFDQLDDDQFKTKEPCSYNEDYFDLQCGRVVKMNFSLERIEHLIEIKEILQKEQHKGFEVTVSNQFIQAETKRDTNFQPSRRLKDAVLSKNKEKIKMELEFEVDNDTLEIIDVIQSGLYVLDAQPDLFDEYIANNRTPAIIDISSNWNKNYYLKQKVYFRDNFAIERFMHLLNVKLYLREQGDPNFQKIAPRALNNTSRSDKSNARSKSEDCFYKKALMVGGAALAALLIILGIFR